MNSRLRTLGLCSVVSFLQWESQCFNCTLVRELSELGTCLVVLLCSDRALHTQRHTHTCLYTAAAKWLQPCPTLCDPIDGSPPGSAVPGILQAGTLEWVAIAFSDEWKWKVKVKLVSRVWLLVTPWTAAYQAPPSMGFSRQDYWSGVPSPSPMFIYTCWEINHGFYKYSDQYHKVF